MGDSGSESIYGQVDGRARTSLYFVSNASE